MRWTDGQTDGQTDGWTDDGAKRVFSFCELGTVQHFIHILPFSILAILS